MDTILTSEIDSNFRRKCVHIPSNNKTRIFDFIGQPQSKRHNNSNSIHLGNISIRNK